MNPVSLIISLDWKLYANKTTNSKYEKLYAFNYEQKFYSDKALNWFSPWPPSFSFLRDSVFCKRNRLFNFCRLSLFSCPSPFWRQAWSRQQVIVLKADVHRHFFFFLLIKNGLYEFYILWKEVTLGVKKIRHFYFQERSRVEWSRAVRKILR